MERSFTYEMTLQEMAKAAEVQYPFQSLECWKGQHRGSVLIPDILYTPFTRKLLSLCREPSFKSVFHSLESALKEMGYRSANLAELLHFSAARTSYLEKPVTILCPGSPDFEAVPVLYRDEDATKFGFFGALQFCRYPRKAPLPVGEVDRLLVVKL